MKIKNNAFGASLIVLLGCGIGNPSLVREKAQNVIDAPGSELAESYLQKTPARAIAPNLTLEEAKEIQQQFLGEIREELGPVVGYKAGLTSETAQQQFNVSQPLLGTLFQQMLLPNGQIISPQFGSRPMSEGDLMVRVGSEEINNAKTPQEALASLDAVIPFIELPDLVYSPDVKLNGPAILAINVGARYGVVGEPILLSPTEEWEGRLKNLTLEILDADGKVLATGKGSNLLGNPLNVVLWIRDSLRAEGKQLKKGDLLSLGTITPLMPVKPNTSIRARYTGLKADETVEIFVVFEE
jgi:2-keto-4-pentenoate hydratase